MWFPNIFVGSNPLNGDTEYNFDDESIAATSICKVDDDDAPFLNLGMENFVEGDFIPTFEYQELPEGPLNLPFSGLEINMNTRQARIPTKGIQLGFLIVSLDRTVRVRVNRNDEIVDVCKKISNEWPGLRGRDFRAPDPFTLRLQYRDQFLPLHFTVEKANLFFISKEVKVILVDDGDDASDCEAARFSTPEKLGNSKEDDEPQKTSPTKSSTTASSPHQSISFESSGEKKRKNNVNREEPFDSFFDGNVSIVKDDINKKKKTVKKYVHRDKIDSGDSVCSDATPVGGNNNHYESPLMCCQIS